MHGGVDSFYMRLSTCQDPGVEDIVVYLRQDFRVTKLMRGFSLLHHCNRVLGMIDQTKMP
jgi:hypothetical protein